MKVQLVSSGTNTADNPTIYELFGTNGVLPDGLTMSESGLITGIPSNDIETSGGKKQFNTYIRVGNKTVSGSPQTLFDAYKKQHTCCRHCDIVLAGVVVFWTDGMRR